MKISKILHHRDKSQVPSIHRKKVQILIILGVLIAACLAIWIIQSYILAPRLTEENNQIPQMMYRMNPQHTGVYTSVSGGISPQGRSAWNFTLPRLVLMTSPVVLNNTLFFSTGNDDIFALNATTGQEIWHRRIKDQDGGSLAVAGDTLFTTIYDRTSSDTSKYHSDMFALFTSNGSTKWHITLGSGEASALTVSNGGVFTTLDNAVYVIDSETGRQIWNVKDDRYLKGEIPTVDNGTIYIAGADHVYAYYAENGSRKWTAQTAGSSVGPLVVQNGRVYNEGQFINQTAILDAVYALDTGTGTLLWTFTSWNSSFESVFTPFVATNDTLYFGSSSSPFVATNNTIIGNFTNTMYALDATTGAVKWTRDFNENVSTPSLIGAPSFADGILYFTCGDGKLYALDGRSGTVKWTYDIGLPGGEPVIVNGTVYAVGSSRSDQGYTVTLYAIQ